MSAGRAIQHASCDAERMEKKWVQVLGTVVKKSKHAKNQ